MGFCLVLSVFHFHIIFFSAEDNADGGIVARMVPIVEKIQVKIHLARMLRLEDADFQFKRDQGLQKAMIEKQVDEVFLFPKS